MHHIHRFDENGVYIDRWETYGSEEGQFDSPKGLALSPDGFLYVADTDNHRIQKFDKDGNFVVQWGGFGDDDEKLALPSDLAMSPDGFLYVADTDNHRIQKFDKDGNFISTLGTYGSGEGQFRYPAGVAAGFDGFLYVADTDNHRIQKFDKDGNFVTQWGSFGVDDGMFIYPTRVAVGPDGCLYVTESLDQRSELSNDRIQKFDADGFFIEKWDNMILGNPRFYDPSGIAIGQDGTVYVADRHDSRVLKLDSSGKEALFRSNIPVNQPAGVSRQYFTDVGNLNVSGKFYLEATLINSLGQRVAQSTYPFYIMKGNIYFTFSTDKAMYKPGETVIIQGEVRNFASLALNGVSLVLTRKTSTGEEAIDSIAFDLPSNGSFSFTSTAQAETEGAFILIGTLTHEDSTLFEASDQYDVAAPKVSCVIAGPDDVGNDPFTLSATVFNEGKTDTSVVLTSPFDSQSLFVPAGSSRMFLYQPQTITQDTLYTFTLSGDVNRIASKMVRYGLSASLTASAALIYPQGNISIPISANNTGNLDGSFLIDVLLQPSGLSFQKSYIIPHGQTASDTLVFDLTEGDYTLTLTSQTPPASTSASFSVKKENNISVAPIVIGTPTNGLITVSTELSNCGYNGVNGSIQLSILNSQGVVVWQSSQEMSLQANSSPSPIPVSLPFSQAILQSGSYTVKVAFLNGSGQELASKTSLFVVSGANLRLAQIPSSQTVSAGEEAAFAFVVTNTGGKEASAELTLKSHDFINLTQRAVVNPGEEKSFSFAFPIPADLEEKDYYAEYELKDVSGTLAKGQVRYHVAGINISVAASLDKNHYREGENAHLALIINQQTGGTTRNLFARVNYGDFESKQSFVLTGSQNLSFAIPLTAITGEKLFFGIYDEGGRSIHLNSLYIYKTGDAFTITTNKQVYNQGETVNMTIEGTGTGTMTISGPGGYSETFPFNGSATRSFILPQAARAGTYHIEASLATTEGQTTHATKPIDIAGISVKVKQAALDKGKYLPGEPLHLFLRIESNSDLPVTLKVWSVGPDKNSNFLGEQQFPLIRAEQVLLTTEYPATVTASGIQKLFYGIYSDSMLLSSGNLSFDAGDGVILGMTTDRSDYPLGSESVAVKLNIFGLTDATLTLKINGAVVHSETISLSGFSTIIIPISDLGPGAHTLEAVLTAGGLSSTKETSFLYGTNLSDIAADVWSSGTIIGKDGTMKLFATAGNRGKTIAIPTSMTLHDGDTMLATFPVGELAPGTSQSFEFLWNVIGKAGEHTLQAIVDPQNVHTEFTKDNNRVTRRIVIPDVALITETDKVNYGMGEQVVINATSINLTAGTNYPNLTCTTIVRDLSGNEVFRQSKSLSLSPSQTGETTATWNTAGLTGEGKYTIRQEIATGATVIAEKTKVITITAGSGFSLEVNPASVKVKQGETGHFTISVGVPSGWGGSVTLDAQGIPEGTTASFVPNIITGSGTSVVSVTTSATTPPGTYTLILRGQSNDGPGGTTQIIPTTLDVAGFSLQAVPESISIIQQETADFTIRATSLNDYTGALVLSDTNGRIGGLLLTIDNPNLSVPGGETVVRVQSSKYVPPGTYTIKLSGSDGILSRDVTLSVGVTQNPGIAPGFVVTPGPGFDNRALVTLLNRNFVEKVEFNAFKTRFGANAVMGDIDGDGEDEIIVTPGPDPLADGRVKIFRQDGALILEQPVLATKFGAYLTAGDIDGDWQEEVVVGAGPGLKNTARIKVLSFDGQGLSNTGINFVAFPTVYRLGVRVAIGDVDGDGIMEIIAGAGPSPLSPARVKVFKVDTSDGTGSWRISSTHADFIVDFGDWYPYIFGVNVAAGDIDGDGKAEIIAGAGPNPLQKAIVAVYRGDGTFTGTRFEAYPSNEYRFGVNVTARDLDGDGVAEIITGPGPSPFSDSWIRVFRGDGTLLSDGFLAFPESTKFGAKVATGNTGE